MKQHRSLAFSFFIPMLIIGFFLIFACSLLHMARSSLSIPGLNPLESHILLAASEWPQIAIYAIGISLFLYVTWGKTITHIYSQTLIGLALLIIISGLITFIPSRQIPESIILTKATLGTKISLLVNIWPIIQFHIFSKIFAFSLVGTLVWSLMNRIAKPRDGFLLYIPIAFIFDFFGGILYLLTKSFAFATWGFTTLVVFALIALGIAWIVSRISWKNITDAAHFEPPNPDEPVEFLRFPFLSGAYFIAGNLLMATTFNFLFKNWARGHATTATHYHELMSRYSVYSGSITIGIAILSVIVGLLVLLKRNGWIKLAWLASGLIFIGALLELGIPLISGGKIDFGVHTVYMAALNGFRPLLLFPLIQMLYLYIPTNARWSGQAIVHLLLLPPLMKFFSYVNVNLILWTGSAEHSLPYVKWIGLIASLVLIFVTVRLSRWQNSMESVR